MRFIKNREVGQTRSKDRCQHLSKLRDEEDEKGKHQHVL